MIVRLLASNSVRHRFGGVSAMTLHRWMNSIEMTFPQPIKIGNRNFWRETDLDAWENSRPIRSKLEAI